MGGCSSKQTGGQLNVRASRASRQYEGQQLVLYTALSRPTLDTVSCMQKRLIFHFSPSDFLTFAIGVGDYNTLLFFSFLTIKVYIIL